MLFLFAGLGFVVIVLAIFLVFSVRLLFVRKAMKRLFEKPYGEIISPEKTRNLVERINGTSKDLTFSTHKVVQVSFRGQLVQLVDGTVSYIALLAKGKTGRQSERCLFVVFPNDRTHFFTEHTDVFRKGFTGSQYSVFFAEPLKMIAALNQDLSAQRK
jgi:hypothetical protein